MEIIRIPIEKGSEERLERDGVAEGYQLQRRMKESSAMPELIDSEAL
jgi:hypothetical protein